MWRLRGRVPMTGTLRPVTFWCTKPAGGWPISSAAGHATMAVDRRHPTVLASTPALSEAMTRLVERVERERSGEVPTRSN